MGDLSMFMPITKVDAMHRLVFGVATAEVEDRAGEICDYESTKSHYERWSNEIAQSTGGKSLGNLRAMHNAIAAGKVTAITFNDEAKQIEICVKVVDDCEWKKVIEGVYTGFSQGGVYERRWTDETGRLRYTAVPTEISLVDLPCLPLARFELIKFDGTRELRGFKEQSQIDLGLDEAKQNIDSREALTDQEIRDMPEVAALLDDLQALLRRILDVLRGLSSISDPKMDQLRGDPCGASGAVGKNVCVDPDRPTKKVFTRSLADLECGHKREAWRRHSLENQHLQYADRQTDRWALDKRYDKLSETLADVLQRVKNIENQPIPFPYSGRPRPIAKHEDRADRNSSEATIDALLADPEALSILAIKLAHRNGRGPVS